MDEAALLTSPLVVEGEETGGSEESEDDPLDTLFWVSSWPLERKKKKS